MEPKTKQPESLAGHLRDINAASRCAHLKPTLNIAVQLVPVADEAPSMLTVPGKQGEPKIKLARQLTGRPQLGFFCTSPKVYTSLTQNMVEDIRVQLPTNGFLTTFDYCRMCGCWEPGKKE
jgi:hypothetical protein